MHLKFTKHGQGSAKKAASYLLQEMDHKGERRAKIVQLRGDINLVAAVADSLNFQWIYSSAVIAWAQEDNPTDAQIEAVLDDFDRVAFAGMELHQFSRAAILHVDDDGAKHIHVIVARVDLETGKSFNPAPPGWQKFYDPMRDFHNYDNDWSRPDDPANRRPAQLSAAEFHGLSDRKSMKIEINEYIKDQVLSGHITDRPDVISKLQKFGTVNKVSPQGISINVSGFAKPIRMTGLFYDDKFDESIAVIFRENAAVVSSDTKESNEISATAALKELEKRIKQREQFFREQYRKNAVLSADSSHILKIEQGAPLDDEIDSYETSMVIDSAIDTNEQLGSNIEIHEDNSADQKRSVEPLLEFMNRSLVSDDLLPAFHDMVNGSFKIKSSVDQSDTVKIHYQSSFDLERSDQANHVRLAWLDDWYQLRNSFLNKSGNIYDGVRTALNEWFEESFQTISAGYDCYQSAESSIGRASGNLEQAIARVEQAISTNDRNLAQFTQGLPLVFSKIDEELTSFRKEINLVAYAGSQGYVVDHHSSSQSSVVMQSDRDTIMIATHTDGQGIYFSLHDEADCGSITNFIEIRHGFSLYQVRQELRSWIANPHALQFTDSSQIPKPTISSTERQKVTVDFLRMKPLPLEGHPYFLSKGITPEILNDPRFVEYIKMDSTGHAVFPHYDSSGLTGYELIKEDATEFDFVGERRIWRTGNANKATRYVIVESVTDALNHAQLSENIEFSYFSIGVNPSQDTWQLIELELKKIEGRGADIIIATERDEFGDKLMELAPRAIRESPNDFDWYDHDVDSSDYQHEYEDYFADDLDADDSEQTLGF